MRIGLFDSGIGGLNVLSEFVKKYPNNDYIYYGDTLNLPYGEKTKDELLVLSKKIIKFLINEKVDLIIIACGTVSSTCYLELKNMTNIKVYNIITATTEYVLNNNYQNIGVIATKRTIDSHIFKKILNNNIKEIATNEFVLMIENNQIDENIIKKYINSLGDIDTLILGCTHYPLLKKYLKKYLKTNTKIIDMGKCLLNKLSLDNLGTGQIKLYFSKVDQKLLENVSKIILTQYFIEEKKL